MYKEAWSISLPGEVLCSVETCTGESFSCSLDRAALLRELGFHPCLHKDSLKNNYTEHQLQRSKAMDLQQMMRRDKQTDHSGKHVWP
jgi:hypothetical protein